MGEADFPPLNQTLSGTATLNLRTAPAKVRFKALAGYLTPEIKPCKGLIFKYAHSKAGKWA